jgi:hypothetical protein
MNKGKEKRRSSPQIMKHEKDAIAGVFRRFQFMTIRGQGSNQVLHA